MKTDNANSAPTSAATSAGAKSTAPNTTTPVPEAEAKAVAKAGVGEGAYLSRQQQLATQAIAETVSEIKKTVSRAVDPRMLMDRYPWVTLCASAVAGFAAAATFIPSKEQQALRKLAAIERALHPPAKAPASDVHTSAAPPADGVAPKPGRSGIMQAVIKELVGAIKPAIISLLSAGVSAAAARPSEEEMKSAAAEEEAQRVG